MKEENLTKAQRLHFKGLRVCTDGKPQFKHSFKARETPYLNKHFVATAIKLVLLEKINPYL